MKQKTKDILLFILGVFLFALAFILLMLMITYLPTFQEEITLGESASGFCKSKGGVYMDNLFEESVCHIDGKRFWVYYTGDSWRLSK